MDDTEKILALIERLKFLRSRLVWMHIRGQRFTLKWWRIMADMHLEQHYKIRPAYDAITESGKQKYVGDDDEFRVMIDQNRLAQRFWFWYGLVKDTYERGANEGLRRLNVGRLELEFGSFITGGGMTFNAAKSEPNLIGDDADTEQWPGLAAYRAYMRKLGIQV